MFYPDIIKNFLEKIMKKIILSAVLTAAFFMNSFALDEYEVIYKLYRYLAAAKTPANGEIDIRFGIDPLSGIYYYSGSGNNWDNYSSVPNVGFSAGAEYVVPVSAMFKLGAGAQYVIPRQADGHQSFDGKFSFLPVYAIFAVDPVWFLPNIFVKVNGGYSFAYFQNGGSHGVVNSNSGGLTWGAAIGANITKNWVIEISYNKFYSALEIVRENGSAGTKNVSFNKLGISLMYRIKL
jgi:hypothetical protein